MTQAMKPGATPWIIKEQIVEDLPTGLTFQFERVHDDKESPMRLRIFGKFLPVPNREILFARNGGIRGAGTFLGGDKPAWRIRSDEELFQELGDATAQVGEMEANVVDTCDLQTKVMESLRPQAPELVVTKQGHVFQCIEKGVMPDTEIIVGRGMDVAEAVGDWCIHKGLVQVQCEPTKLLDMYQVRSLTKKGALPKKKMQFVPFRS